MTEGPNEVGELVDRLKAMATCPPEQIYPVDYEWFGKAADTLLSQQREIERLKEAFALQAQIWEREFRARCKLETDLYLASGAPQERKDER